jgi:catechol 2,3-dioxygenase-like lactoylglutathione lyase family enzyme
MEAVTQRPGMVDLDHISAPVRDLRAARKFYGAALGAIGMRVNLEYGSAFGMGSKGEKVFWLIRDRAATGKAHYAFRVATRGEVDSFYTAALKAGGKDHGKPGLRPGYGANYYAAFVKDLEGNNVEVVCYAASPKRRKRSTATTPKRRAVLTGRRKSARSPRR